VETIKSRLEINDTETKRTMQRINEKEVVLCKIDKPLARLIRPEKKSKLIN
jgi:hypothetical protein